MHQQKNNKGFKFKPKQKFQVKFYKFSAGIFFNNSELGVSFCCGLVAIVFYQVLSSRKTLGIQCFIQMSSIVDILQSGIGLL